MTSCWPWFRYSMSSGSTQCWAAALMSGARLVIMDGFDGFADVVAEEKITNLPVAPAVLTRDSGRRAGHCQPEDR